MINIVALYMHVVNRNVKSEMHGVKDINTFKAIFSGVASFSWM